MKRVIVVVMLLLHASWCAIGSAQTPDTKPSKESSAGIPPEPPQPTVTNFLQGWGVGLAMIRNSRKVISDASVVNGIVRANSEHTWQSTLLLAKHWYFENPNTKQCLLKKDYQLCLGVFVGVGLGGGASSNQIIDMIGGGLLLGFGPGTDNVQKQAHNVGIGVGRRFNVKVLGDGISANAPLPAGETQVRFKITDITAPFLFYTYKF